MGRTVEAPAHGSHSPDQSPITLEPITPPRLEHKKNWKTGTAQDILEYVQKVFSRPDLSFDTLLHFLKDNKHEVTVLHKSGSSLRGGIVTISEEGLTIGLTLGQVTSHVVSADQELEFQVLPIPGSSVFTKDWRDSIKR